MYPFSKKYSVPPPVGKTETVNEAGLAFPLVTLREDTMAELAAGTVYRVVSVAALGIVYCRKNLLAIYIADTKLTETITEGISGRVGFVPAA